MAGRKTPPKQDLLSTLLGKFGLAQPKKGAKKKKRPRPRPSEGYEAPAASPFADYAQESGLGFTEGYEAAAAMGYAPPPPPTIEPLFPDPEPALPSFGGPAAPPAAPAFSAAVSMPPPAPGKLFSEEALDNSLDALFAGLEMGTAPESSLSAFEPPAATEAPKSPTGNIPSGVPAGSGNIVAFPGTQAASSAPSAVAEAPPAPIVTAPPAPKTPSFTVETPAPAPAPVPGPIMPAASYSGDLPAPVKVTLSQGTDLRTLLATIDRTAGVTGSLLVGYDGLIIAFTLPPTVDRDYLAAQACNMFTGAGQQMERLERGELRRMVLETSDGAMLMTAADMGILVVVSDGQSMDVRGVSAAIAGALGQA